MYINFVTLMLIYVIISFGYQGVFSWRALNQRDHKSWAILYFILGLLGIITGVYMTFTWPLPGSYNILFGEPTLLLGLLQLGAALLLWNNRKLSPLSIFTSIAGLVACYLGYRSLDLELTIAPTLSGIGYILSGLSGLAVYPLLKWRQQVVIRSLYTALCTIIVLIWSIIVLMAYWGHLQEFQQWEPQPYQEAVQIEQNGGASR